MTSVLEILGNAILWGFGLLMTNMVSVLYTYFAIKICRYFAEEWKIKREIKRKREIKKNNNKE